MKNLLRYLLATIMWKIQCFFVWYTPMHRMPFTPYSGGRRIDWEPWRCPECGWTGPLRWAVHTYEDDGSGEDVEAIDECPRCGCNEILSAASS